MMPQARLQINVHPGARRTEIVGFQGDTLRIRVAAPPERGRANQAAVELLAKALGIAKSRLAVVQGSARREKLLLIEGVDVQEVRRRLALDAGDYDPADDLENDDGHHR